MHNIKFRATTKRHNFVLSTYQNKEGEEQVATLAVSPTEYVVDSHTMAALGNGNPDKGADYMDAVVKGIRQEAYGTDEQPNEINGLQTLVSMMG